MIRRPVRHAHLAWILPALLLTGACDDQPAKPQANKPETTKPKPTSDVWLDQFSSERPAEWLVRHQKYAEPDSLDSNSTQVFFLLRLAAQRFQESPRMIANRALQLQGMLEKDGEHVPAAAIIRDLSAVATDDATNPGFGNLAAYYLTLRKSGRSRDEALSELAQKYGGMAP